MHSDIKNMPPRRTVVKDLDDSPLEKGGDTNRAILLQEAELAKFQDPPLSMKYNYEMNMTEPPGGQGKAMNYYPSF
jgi:hypothetical protein